MNVPPPQNRPRCLDFDHLTGYASLRVVRVFFGGLMSYSRGISSFCFVMFLAVCAVGANGTGKPSGAARLSAMMRQVDSDPRLAGINRDEELVEELRQAVLLPWESAWKGGDAAAFAALGPAGARWDSSARKLVRDKDGIREYRWDLRDGGDASEAKKYLSRFQKVDDFRLAVLKIEPSDARAGLKVSFDLRGVTQKGGRRHDRGELQLGLARQGGAWRLESISPGKLESLEAERPIFEDGTAAWGLAGVPVTDRREAIRRGGYALAAADYDGDGRPDLLVGGWGPVKLYRNTGKRFVDVTAAAGLLLARAINPRTEAE